eukprot:c20873_g1_i1 orf=291-1298(-)
MALARDFWLISTLCVLLVCQICTPGVALETATSPPVELSQVELGNIELLWHGASQFVFPILITVFCCVLGLWISGSVKFSRIPVCLSGGISQNRVRTAVNGSWKADGCNCFYARICDSNAVEKLDSLQLAVSQPGASMMEHLVPEITHHMLSYLDYKSLCNVSMTNSAMRRAANDDSAWKALFHKDFTVEQSSIATPNGWKAHFAVTKAVMETNRNFYKSFCAKSLRGMSRLWLCADYVKCTRPGGEFLSGYDAIMENWRAVFSWSQKFDFKLRDERVRVMGNMAWVTLKEFINSSVDPLLATNIYEFHDGHWYMVHHHSSPQLEGGNIEYGGFG